MNEMLFGLCFGILIGYAWRDTFVFLDTLFAYKDERKDGNDI